MDIFLFSIFILVGLAVFDLMVGVSNDAVNFLNSSIGSRVAPRNVIMVIASLGMLAGVTFSSGMMEVARKGIFHPQYFYMPELLTIFLAVMLTDIILLDLFNTFGLPTSTTVSIVFELLGAAVAVSLLKIYQSGESFVTLVNYINSAKALVIISGILLSVVIAFVFGALVQFVTRLIFTFDYATRLRRYGGIWGGVALSAITYFILIKGAKGASFITPETLVWIKTNTLLILFVNFCVFAVLFQILATFTRINILKPIVLVGTFALAMAFAANDLVNFIGVPLAGMNAYQLAAGTGDPLTASMAALQEKVPSNTGILLAAGLIMVVTLWLSKKARTVTETEVSLGRQDEGIENFGASLLSRIIVRMVSAQYDLVKKVFPEPLRRAVARRLNPDAYAPASSDGDDPPSFDLLRASVNLMVASAVVSYATSHKLPLSTTYVTFMVAMGTSLADQAWGRESAVYRVTGVLTVVGGWFVTALVAFTVSSIFAAVVYYLKLPAILILLVVGILLIWRNYKLHFKRQKEADSIKAFSLKQVKSAAEAVQTSFTHAGMFLQQVGLNLKNCFEGVSAEDRQVLKLARAETSKIQKWANVIIANTFKTLFLLHKEEVETAQKYSRIVRSLQTIAERHRDIILRAYVHVENNHSGLLPVQKEELGQVRDKLVDLTESASQMLLEEETMDYRLVESQYEALRAMIIRFDKHQVRRIQEGESKTRLSILFYGFLEDSRKIAKHIHKLMSLFRESFSLVSSD